MVNIVHLFLVTVSISVVGIYCSLESILSDYYKSEALKSFKSEWRKHKIAYENALVVALRESYGAMAMNVFVKRESSRRTTISKGFMFSDNVVKVLLFDMVLRDMPNLFMPDVSLELPSNKLKLEGTVSKIFIDTSYYMARSDAAIFYGSEKDLGKKQSPFSLQQVQTYGKLVIIAEDCFLNGFAIVTLAAESVNVGHSTFHLNDCKFTVEISPSDFSLPPVIAPYFTKNTGRQIERLMSEALLSELSPKLQGAMYSYINTSTSFGDDLSKYRFNQQKIFKKTSDYLSDFCVKLNNLTLQENKGSVNLKDFEVRIETKTDEVKHSHLVALKEMKLYGLDTAYAARTGGSFETPQLSLADAIRFSSMQIRGKAPFENGTQTGMHDFAAELIDVKVNIIIHIKPGSKPSTQCEVVGWRTLDFSIVPWETPLRERFGYQSLVTGYIINEVPPRIIEHLSKVLTPIVDEEPYEENLKGIGQTDIDKDNGGNEKDDQNNDTIDQGEKNDEKNDQDDDEDDQDNDKDDAGNEKDEEDNDNNDEENDKNDENNDKDDQNDEGLFSDGFNDESFFDDNAKKSIILEDGTKVAVLSDQKLNEEYDEGFDHNEQEPPKDYKAYEEYNEENDNDKEPKPPKDYKAYEEYNEENDNDKEPEPSKDYKEDEVDDDYGVDNGKTQEPPNDYKAEEALDYDGMDNGNAQEEKDLIIFASEGEGEMTRRTGKRNQSSKSRKTNHSYYNKNRKFIIQKRLNKTTPNRNNNNSSELPKLTFRKNLRVNIKKVSTKKESFTNKKFQGQVIDNTTQLPSVPHMSDNEIQ